MEVPAVKPMLLSRDRIVTDIHLAVLLTPASVIRREHPNRPFHGFAYSFDICTDYRFSDGTLIRVEPGDLIYLPRASSYTVASGDRGYCGAVNFSMVEYPDEPPPLPPFKLALRDTASVERIYRDADRQWKHFADGRTDHGRAAVYALFAILREACGRPYLSAAHNRTLDLVTTYIDEHFGEPELTVAGLAAVAGVSETWLRRLFVSRFGITPSRYIMNRRIGHARELIASRLCTIESAGRMAGFEDPAHFSRTFRSEVGMTPREYRDSTKETP